MLGAQIPCHIKSLLPANQDLPCECAILGFCHLSLVDFVFWQALTNTLWYLTNQHATINERSRKEKSVLGIPPASDSFQGYNEFRRKKLEAQPLDAEQLRSHADILYSLCLQSVMRSSPSWETAYNDIKSLAECLMSYSQYLNVQNEKFKTLSNLDHPVRQVSEHTTVTLINRGGCDIRVD